MHGYPECLCDQCIYGQFPSLTPSERDWLYEKMKTQENLPDPEKLVVDL